jgi:hypothetical protein
MTPARPGALIIDPQHALPLSSRLILHRKRSMEKKYGLTLSPQRTTLRASKPLPVPQQLPEARADSAAQE